MSQWTRVPILNRRVTSGHRERVAETATVRVSDPGGVALENKYSALPYVVGCLTTEEIRTVHACMHDNGMQDGDAFFPSLGLSAADVAIGKLCYADVGPKSSSSSSSSVPALNLPGIGRNDASKFKRQSGMLESMLQDEGV